MKRNESIFMSCPFCNEVIGKSTWTENTELRCPKCKKYWIINYRNSALTIREHEVTYQAEA